MTLVNISLLLAALSSSALALSNVANPNANHAYPNGNAPAIDSILIPRQAAGNGVGGQQVAAPTPVETQFGTVMTEYLPPTNTLIESTWTPDIYTQTFAAVPDQLPGPGVGSIGLGTLTKHSKRDATPEETGIAGRLRV
ncbi:Hypothetical protein R9X50_00477900 [Acrodontium crateriforme]|uniref:Uncharacterized protein n=1 Tax=Acrodontium crateriforme TaxID=150365 RepID=A0AAQ3M6T1_9PEZI|nr:Hypothetical protein R9X50_00477900 [Acrodontium crateriforme]